MIRQGGLLPPAFFARDTVRVARALLGQVLESRVDGVRTAGRIVEVEAYIGAHDPADHGYAGRRTLRNAVLFGPPGTVYVYRSYGLHWCFNVVTEVAGRPTAVLVRALEPVAGLEWMARRRGTARARLLCSGPGRLCVALGITGALNGCTLDGAPIGIRRGGRVPARAVAVTGRIGVSRARDWPLRFVVAGSPWLSRGVRDGRAGAPESALG